MNPGTNCCERVVGPRVTVYQCRNRAKVERDGKPYCGIHDPERVAARRRAQDAHYAEKSRQMHRRWDLERSAGPMRSAILLALEDWEGGGAVTAESGEAMRRALPKENR